MDQNAVQPGVPLVKSYTADSIKAEGDRAYTFTISTGSVDRDKDTLAVDGWRVANFLKAGGPVLWAHQSRDLPIGKAPWVKVQGGQLKARVEFAPEEVYPFAETVRKLVDFGALKSTSVGFLPDFDKAAWNEQRGGYDFKGQELMEFSIVPVPSNPEALLEAKSAGIDLAPLKDWAERILDGADGPGLWVPKEQAEAAFKALAAPSVAGFEATVFLDGAQLAFTKAGRRLSAATEERIRTARTAADAIAGALDAVLDSPVVEEPKAAPVAYFVPQPKYLVDPAVVASAVTVAVSRSVLQGINRLRGRID